ncbi:hypothetical protein N3K66_007474 [Trichothecium roseum]|uniref:Uncharacterized protein n=1 Tax=Trichothecium roseum TaxID=47278 RepID=A0ACC0UU35_9HYPO|nr:hypothetical protein N3K66_007474 [Trichothecium roseum]
MAPHPPWLASLLAKPSEAPKLYAWTPANLGLGDEPPRPAPSRTVRDQDPSHRIYILGAGNMGRLYAIYLSKHDPPPPITLVVHRPSLLEAWRSSPGVTFTHHGATETVADLDIEYWTTEEPARGPAREVCDGGFIPNIIVSTKAGDALPEVDRMRRYLSASSTVALAQNGMSKLWPPHGPAYTSARFSRRHGGGGGSTIGGREGEGEGKGKGERLAGSEEEEGKGDEAPNFAHCITTHGVVSLAPFTSRHASLADAKVGLVLPNPRTRGAAEWLLGAIASAPLLDSRRVGRADLWALQLEKLVVNAVINPLTAVLRCKNGALFADGPGGVLAKVMDRLLEETSGVYLRLVSHPSSDAILLSDYGDGTITAAATATATAVNDTNEHDLLVAARARLEPRFAVASLRDMLWAVGRKVTENTSSMLQDVQAGKSTEIRDFNGWILDTARFLDSSSSSSSLPSHQHPRAAEAGCPLPSPPPPPLDVKCHARLMDLVESGVTMTAEQLGEALLGEL